MSFHQRVSGLSQKGKMKSIGQCGRTSGRESLSFTAPKEKVEVVRSSDWDAYWVPPLSNWEETPGKTQVTLERLCVLAGLGMNKCSLLEELEQVAGEREVWVSQL